MPSESWVLLTQQMRGYLILILITSRKRTLSRYSQQYLTTWVSNPGQSTHRVDYHRPSLWFTSTNASSCCWFLSQFLKSQTIKLFLKEFYYHFHVSPSVFCWFLIYEIRVTWQKYYIIYPSDRQISAFSQCCHKSIFFCIFLLFCLEQLSLLTLALNLMGLCHFQGISPLCLHLQSWLVHPSSLFS